VNGLYNDEEKSPWNVRFYCWYCEKDFTDKIVKNIFVTAAELKCKNPFAMAYDIVMFGAVREFNGEKRPPHRKGAIFYV